ncbi:MAG: hypothetical protein KDD64_05755 [Bdellovibrionales bacterium]|nr:hypothetical protein [Bdellovibrionales bacterium]
MNSQSRIAPLSSIMLFFLVLIATGPQTARAGLIGCQSVPSAGDYLDCGINGPFGPGGPDSLECRPYCNALRECLNDPPVGGCGSESQALEACAPGVHDRRYPTHAPLIPPPPAPIPTTTTPSGGTIGFLPGVGCIVEPAEEERALSKESLSSRGNVNTQYRTTGEWVNCPSDVVIAYVAAYSDAGPAVIEASAERFIVDSAQLSLSDDFYTDLGASYEDVQAIGNAVASAYGVTVRQEVLDNMNTLQDMANCVKSAMKNSSR